VIDLLIEGRSSGGVEAACERQHLERDVSAETGVTGTIDMSHATGPEKSGDFVSTDTSTH
jgi:hypothetical protein